MRCAGRRLAAHRAAGAWRGGAARAPRGASATAEGLAASGSSAHDGATPGCAAHGGAAVLQDDAHPLRPGQLPPGALEAVLRLAGAGHAAWVVGGAVRDLLLGRGPPKDVDLLTSADLRAARTLLPRSAVIGGCCAAAGGVGVGGGAGVEGGRRGRRAGTGAPRPRLSALTSLPARVPVGRRHPIVHAELGGAAVEVASLATGTEAGQLPPDAARLAGGGGGGDGGSGGGGGGSGGAVALGLPQLGGQSWAAARRANAAGEQRACARSCSPGARAPAPAEPAFALPPSC
jgi:hypothetical protein